MVAINAKFNGKVFVPDEPVSLPNGQRVVVQVATTSTPAELLTAFAGTIDAQDLKSIAEAVDADRKASLNEW